MRQSILIIFLALSTQLSQAQVWEALGPNGGWAQRVEFDPHNSSLIYVGGDLLHGIMESSDLGENWEQLDSYGTIDAWTLTPDKKVSGRTYASSMMSPNTYNPLLLRTENGGTTWDTLFSGTHISDVTIDPDNSDIIYLAAGQWQGNPSSGYGSGVWKSTDGGENFSQIGLDTLNIQSIMVHPKFTNAVFAAAYDANSLRPTGVFASVDNGDTWFPAGLNDKQAWHLAIGNGANAPLYAACFDGVYRSTDLGANWTRMDMPINLPWEIEVSPKDNNTVYAVGLGESETIKGGVFKSIDGGDSWTQLTSGLLSDRIWSVSIHPENPDTVFITTQGDGIFKSLDGGSTWSEANGGYSSHYLNDIQVDGKGGIFVGFYNEHGNQFSSLRHWNETEGWSESGYENDDLIQSIAINPLNNQEVLVSDVTQDFVSPFGGEAFLSTDGGNSLNQVSGKSSDYFFEEIIFDRINNGHVIAGSSLDLAFTHGNGIYQSNNSGADWTQTHFTGTSVTSVFQDYHNGNNFYAAPYLKGFWQSSDGGASWDSLGFGGWPLILDLEQDRHDNNTFYAATFEDGLKKSTDGGINWTNSGFMGSSPTSVISDPVQENTLYVTGSGLRLPGLGVWKSEDNGSTWEDISTDLPTKLIDKIEIDTVTGYLYAISQGNGVFRTQIFTPIVGIESEIVKEASIFHVVNPLQEQLIINCKLKGGFDYIIRDSRGVLIQEGHSNRSKKQITSTPWSKGIYLVQLKQNDVIEQFKLVKNGG